MKTAAILAKKTLFLEVVLTFWCSIGSANLQTCSFKKYLRNMGILFQMRTGGTFLAPYKAIGLNRHMFLFVCIYNKLHCYFSQFFGHNSAKIFFQKSETKLCVSMFFIRTRNFKSFCL